MRFHVLVLACTLALAAACGGSVNGGTMSGENTPGGPGENAPDRGGFDAAWERVRNASDADAQRREIIDFLRRNEAAGAPALQVAVRNLDTGAKAPIDDALWANPEKFEVQLRFGDRVYAFVPKSRASLEPLFRE